MTLYLDVIWVLNYLIDYLLLLLTALVLKRRHSKIRFTFGAFVASLIVFLMFTPIGEWFYHPVTKLVYSVLIVFVAFGYKRFTYYIQGLLMFYFVTFMTGGALFALHFFWQSELPISSEGLIPHASIGSPISWMLVVFGFPLVWYFSKHRFETIEVKSFNLHQLAEVEVAIGEHIFHLKGLIDSGNQLSDPITKAPVMIMQANQLEEVFGQDVVRAIIQLETDGSSGTKRHWLFDRLRIVPFRAVGQANPYLPAIKPDQVTVIHQNQRFKTSQVLIGVQAIDLSPEGAYQAILHPKQVLGAPSEQLA